MRQPEVREYAPTVIPRGTYVKLFVFSMLLYVLTASGRFYSADGITMFTMTTAIVDRGSITIEEYHGDKYSLYGPMQSVAAVPLYVISKPFQWAAEKLFPGAIPKTWTLAFFNCIVTALGAVVMAAAAAELGVSVLGALITALLWGLCTIAWPYAKQCWSEPLWSLFLMLVLLYSFRSVRRGSARNAALAGMFFGFSFLTKYAGAALMPVFFLGIMGPKKDRWRRITAFLIPVAACVMVSMAYNYVRFGSVTETGYVISDTTQRLESILEYKPLPSLLKCFYIVLFSSIKSIFIYSPPLALAFFGLRAFWSRSRVLVVTMGLAFFVTAAVHSRFSLCTGGMAWGARYFLPFTAMGLWVAAPFVDRAVTELKVRWRRVLVIGLAAAGFALQLLAVSVRMNIAHQNNSATTCLFKRLSGEEPENENNDCMNPILSEMRILSERAPRMIKVAFDTLRGKKYINDPNETLEQTYLDYWQAYMLPMLPVWAAWLLVAAVAGMFVFEVLLLRSLFRGIPRAAPESESGDQ